MRLCCLFCQNYFLYYYYYLQTKNSFKVVPNSYRWKILTLIYQKRRKWQAKSILIGLYISLNQEREYICVWLLSNTEPVTCRQRIRFIVRVQSEFDVRARSLKLYRDKLQLKVYQNGKFLYTLTHSRKNQLRK